MKARLSRKTGLSSAVDVSRGCVQRQRCRWPRPNDSGVISIRALPNHGRKGAVEEPLSAFYRLCGAGIQAICNAHVIRAQRGAVTPVGRSEHGGPKVRVAGPLWVRDVWRALTVTGVRAGSAWHTCLRFWGASALTPPLSFWLRPRADAAR